MKYPWTDEYLMNKKGTEKDLQPDWNWIRYKLDGKMYCAVCLDDDNAPVYITLKLPVEEGQLMRNLYDDVIPGYYMNKDHWNSIRADGSVPDDAVKSMMDMAYKTVLSSLSKKKQRQIAAMEE